MLLRLCTALYVALIVVEWIRSRRHVRFLLELIPLVALIALNAVLAVETTGYIAFGETAPTTVVVIMFGAVLLGTAARYLFYLRGKFSWLGFTKPLCISPLVLLPLIGSVQGATNLQPMQVLSFALLAFQNGFFWQVVLERAKATT